MTTTHDTFVLIAGAQKCGTTTLFSHMIRSPAFVDSETKELYYFEKVEHCTKADYVTWFPKNEDGKMYLDATPSYLYRDGVDEKIHRTLNGDAKIIACIRDPVKRAYSHYKMNLRLGEESESFDKAVARMSRDPVDSYVPRGQYASQIKRFMNLFGEKNVLVLTLEEDMRDLPSLNRKLEAFLGQPLGLPETLEVENEAWVAKNPLLKPLLYRSKFKKFVRNSVGPKLRKRLLSFIAAPDTDKRMSEEAYLKLRPFFEEERLELERLLGRSITWEY